MLGRLTTFVGVLAAIPAMAGANQLRDAIAALCGPDPILGGAAEAALPGAWLLEEDMREGPGGPAAIRQRFAMPDGAELRVNRSQPGGALRRMTVERHAPADDGVRAEMQAMATPDCAVMSGRRLIYRDGRAALLEQLDADLETVMWTETLEAPWPQGRDPGGVRVALVDSGLAYDLAPFHNRLARDPDGAPVGRDFWDLDPYTYDANYARGPFLPIRHGTSVASILIEEAPGAALIPLRYPRPDMTRMADVVAHAAENGARIIAMPLGSNNEHDWVAFGDAMRAHPQMLAIVSAGNDGRDVDAQPLWPAALNLDNMLVVTSSDLYGRLALGGNWGATSVDLLTPGENRPVIDFRGSEQRASGSSYAVPRIAALAARMLAADPDLTTTELIDRLTARALPPPQGGVAAIGFIPDPERD